MSELLCFCIPSRGSMSAIAFQHIAGAMVQGSLWWKHRNPNNQVAILNTPRAHVTAARNLMAKHSVDIGADWTMWFDDDAVPPADVVERLFEHEVDIVAPIHRVREEPFRCPAKRVKPDGSTEYADLSSGRLIEVDYMGMHCALIRASVFDVTRRYLLKINPGKYHEGEPFQSLNTLGEDCFFFQAAKGAGYKVWLDTSFEVDHLMETSVMEVMRATS